MYLFEKHRCTEKSHWSPFESQGDMAPITWPGKIIAPRSKRKTLRVTRAAMKFIWANYNDLFPPSSHLKLWFSKGIPLKSPKHSGLGTILICPDLCLVVLYLGIRDCTQLYGGIGCADPDELARAFRMTIFPNWQQGEGWEPTTWGLYDPVIWGL